MARMQDVADDAGVSLMTVSNVVNGRGKMSDATRERVIAAMTRLDYRVNRAARNLRTGKTGVIGLAVPEIDSWYMSQLTTRIIRVVEARGMSVAIELTGASATGELASVAHSRQRMYDGLILSIAGLTPEEVRRIHADTPLVIIGEGIPDAPMDRVALPNTAGGALAAEHLLAQGCRRIALIAQVGEGGALFSSLRARGFTDALAAAGLLLDPRLVVQPASHSMKGGRDAARDLVERGDKFDGIFAATDSVAFGAHRALADVGIRVPDDVMLVGFDDVDEARFTVPSLTTIDPGHDDVATTAVDLLLERIGAGHEAHSARELVHPARLVIRESSTAPGAGSRGG